MSFLTEDLMELTLLSLVVKDGRLRDRSISWPSSLKQRKQAVLEHSYGLSLKNWIERE